MTLALVSILVPVSLGVLALAWPARRGGDAARAWIVLAGGGVHGVLSGLALTRATEERDGWLALDPPGRLVLGLVSVLFLAGAVYGVGYLGQRRERPSRVFCGALLMFLGMMTFIAWTSHLALMWVAVEATTLASAPLVYFNRTPRSLEATWKYLMVGSVGIALALLGSLFLGYAASMGGGGASMRFDELARGAAGFEKAWLHAGFVLLAVGYGTKMGLAPMHTWKPDAYGEAPGLVGALLAGGMTSCAFLAVARVYRVMHAAGESAYAGRVLVILGLLSMAVAAVFVVRQRDYKRMLAYSSVEHMGVMALGLGLGGAGVTGGIFGALLHMVNNGLVKGVLFLSAGNLHRAYGSKRVEDVRGALRAAPWSGAMLLAGFIAATGSPPFGPFVSEFTIIGAALAEHRVPVCAAMLVCLLVVFIGMGAAVLPMVQGTPPARARDATLGERVLTVAPAAGLLAASVVMGLFMPGPVMRLVREAAEYVGGPLP